MIVSKRSAYSLVELLVAMALFTVVIATATGAFIRALRTQRQLVSFAATNSNVSLVLEQMAREIRVGRDFRQSNDRELTFTNARGEKVIYLFENNGNHTGAIFRGVARKQQLTADNVDVRDVRFLLRFNDPNDGYPARITISITVAPKEYGITSSEVHVETTVSARNIGT